MAVRRSRCAFEAARRAPRKNAVAVHGVRDRVVASCTLFSYPSTPAFHLFDVDGTITRNNVSGFVWSMLGGTPALNSRVCRRLDDVVYVTDRPAKLYDATKELLHQRPCLARCL